jgi:hypothetical protein
VDTLLARGWKVADRLYTSGDGEMPPNGNRCRVIDGTAAEFLKERPLVELAHQ